MRLATEKMSEILKEAADARKYSISLAHLEYGDDLVMKMKAHSTKLEQVYAKLQDMNQKGVKSDKRFQKFYDIYDDMHKWYAKAEAIGFPKV